MNESFEGILRYFRDFQLFLEFYGFILTKKNRVKFEFNVFFETVLFFDAFFWVFLARVDN